MDLRLSLGFRGCSLGVWGPWQPFEALRSSDGTQRLLVQDSVERSFDFGAYLGTRTQCLFQLPGAVGSVWLTCREFQGQSCITLVRLQALKLGAFN